MVLPYIIMNLPEVYTCSPSWTLFPPPSPCHPSGSFQCTSPKHPVSCIEPGLATRFIYDIIYVSMPFSQIILPSPSPTEYKRLFYTSVSLLLFFNLCFFDFCYQFCTLKNPIFSTYFYLGVWLLVWLLSPLFDPSFSPTYHLYLLPLLSLLYPTLWIFLRVLGCG